ncbi:MAG: helix-turn-helix domain-containing protein [Verrucomicrobiota bacterium]
MDPRITPQTSKEKELIALLYTRPEAAAKLSISLRNLDEQIAVGNLPVCRIGRSVRIRPSALEFLIEANETRLTPKRRAAIRGNRK